LIFVGKNFESDIKEKTVLVQKDSNIMNSRKLSINVYDSSELVSFAKENNLEFSLIADVFHKWFLGVASLPVKIKKKEAIELGVDIPSSQGVEIKKDKPKAKKKSK
jgi:hypothetical protein